MKIFFQFFTKIGQHPSFFDVLIQSILSLISQQMQILQLPHDQQEYLCLIHRHSLQIGKQQKLKQFPRQLHVIYTNKSLNTQRCDLK